MKIHPATQFKRAHPPININPDISTSQPIGVIGRRTGHLFIDENASIEDEVINKQKVQILLDELKQKLDMQERKILSKYLQGYKYSEIAQKLNVSTKKVDNTITKAKKLVSKYKND